MTVKLPRRLSDVTRSMRSTVSSEQNHNHFNRGKFSYSLATYPLFHDRPANYMRNLIILLIDIQEGRLFHERGMNIFFFLISQYYLFSKVVIFRSLTLGVFTGRDLSGINEQILRVNVQILGINEQILRINEQVCWGLMCGF